MKTKNILQTDVQSFIPATIENQNSQQFDEVETIYGKSHQPERYFELGKIYHQQNQFEKAGAAYQQWLKLINPRYKQAVEAAHEVEMAQEVTPLIPETEVTVGDYQFPAIPPVADSETRPFWSVVITVYNRTEYLFECLNSVLAQWPGEEMEILVMDNASDTPIFEIVNSIGKGVVRYYRNPENVSPVRNMNAGIALSRGHWIHVLHDDDSVLPGFYAQLQQSLEGCTNSVGAAFTSFEYINEKGEVLSEQRCGYDDGQKGIATDWLSKIGVMCIVMLSAVVIRRTTLERLGAYHPQLPEIADWEMDKRIAAHYDWWYEGTTLARYRLHTQRLSNEYWSSWRQVAAFRRAIEMSESYLPTQHRTEITAKASLHYFNTCLVRLSKILKTEDISTAFRLLQEILTLDRSPQAAMNLFVWLTYKEAAPLREEIVSRFLSIPVEEIVA
ncbi:MAG: glycosyltransferase [Calothrix sp. C42_A2020_038]|nr:glycosyltransferase [Calothrix sp. C42_A2020_038]